jgi:hypothetical protein
VLVYGKVILVGDSRRCCARCTVAPLQKGVASLAGKPLLGQVDAQGNNEKLQPLAIRRTPVCARARGRSAENLRLRCWHAFTLFVAMQKPTPTLHRAVDGSRHQCFVLDRCLMDNGTCWPTPPSNFTCREKPSTRIQQLTNLYDAQWGYETRIKAGVAQPGLDASPASRADLPL